MASGGWSFTTILRTLGVRHGGGSGPAVTPQAQDTLLLNTYLPLTVIVFVIDAKWFTEAAARRGFLDFQ